MKSTLSHFNFFSRLTSARTIWLPLALLVAIASGCEEDPTQGNPDEADAVTCDRGVPSKNGKECVNPIKCNGNLKNCLDGFYCNASDRCEARVPCTGANDCNAGKCVFGACINPATCAKHGECVPGDACDLATGLCIESACGKPGEESCKDGGVCIDGSCKNKAVCTVATQDKDCIDGFSCIGGKCEANKACGELTCIDATCANKRACIEPTDCAGDSKNCRYGRYCNGSTCERDLCVVNNVKCAAGSKCNPVDGQCAVVTTCGKDGDCTGGKKCFKADPSSQGMCEEPTQACETACPDTKTCQKNADLTLTCISKEPCETSSDCLGTLICDDTKKCVDGTSLACIEDAIDALGVNNRELDATDFAQESTDNKITDLSICGLDEDFFYLKPGSKYYQDDFVTRVKVTFHPSSIGRGALYVEFFTFDRKFLKSMVVDAKHPTNTVSAELHKINEAVYVRVTDFRKKDTSAKPILKPGIVYDLEIDSAPEGEADACPNAPTLALNTSVDDTFEHSDPKSFKLSCDDSKKGEARDKIYNFTITERQVVKIAVSAKTTESDLMIGVRKDCIDPASELISPAGCVDANGEGANEEWVGILEPGTYTAIVTSKKKKKTGPFAIEITTSATSCDPTIESCTSGGNREVCDALEQNRIEVACTSGCQMQNGKAICKESLGQTCNSAIEIDHVLGYHETLDFSKYTLEGADGDLSLGCPGTGTRYVDGREAFFEVTVPDGSTLVARGIQTGYNKRKSTIYFVDNCAALINRQACLAEHSVDLEVGGQYKGLLSWENTTGASKTVTIVVETEARPYASASYPKIDFEVKVLTSKTCLPGVKRCENKTLEICDDFGSAYTTEQVCPSSSGCVPEDTSTTPPTPAHCAKPLGDDCSNPAPIDGWLLNETLAQSSNVIPRGLSCTDGTQITPYLQSKEDRIFKVSAVEGELLRVLIKPHRNSAGKRWDPYLAVANSCSTTSPSCLTATNEGRGGQPDSIEMIVPTTGDYYIIIDNASTEGTPFSFDLYAKSLPRNCVGAPSCTAGGNLRVCDGFDTEREITCPNGCTSGTDAHCTDVTNAPGDSCASPKVINTSTTKSGTFKLPEIDLEDYAVAPFTFGATGDCTLAYAENCQKFSRFTASTQYEARAAAFDLQPGELLKVDVTFPNIGSQRMNYYYAYITDQMCDVNTCTGMRQNGGGSRYYYNQSGSQKRVYVVTGITLEHSYAQTEPTIQYTITSPSGYSCHPYTSTCISTNQVGICDSAGARTTLNCPAKTVCAHGGCVPSGAGTGVPGNYCTESAPGKGDGAVDIGEGAIIMVDSQPTPSVTDLDNTKNDGCTTSYEANGADFYAAVPLQLGEVLTVKGYGATTIRPIIAISTDCSGTPASEKVCVRGLNTDYSTATEATYVATATQTVYVRLDSNYKPSYKSGNDSLGSPEVAYFVIEKQNTTCRDGDLQCSQTTSNGVVEVCKNGSYTAVETCNGACAATLDRCDTKTGTLYSPNELTGWTVGTESTHDFVFTPSVNSSDLVFKHTGSTNSNLVSGSCVFNKIPDGNDTAFKIDLTAGQRLEVTLEGTPPVSTGMPSDIQLYLVDSRRQDCIINDPNTSKRVDQVARHIEFESLKGGTYYIVVDQSSSSNSHNRNFRLRYKVTDTSSTGCTAGASECTDDNSLRVCETNKTLSNITCPLGCVGRACRAQNTDLGKTLDVCDATSPAMSSSFSLVVDLESMNPDVKMRPANCPGLGGSSSSPTAVGNDAFQRIHLTTGQKIKIKTLRNSSYSIPYVYLVESCAQAKSDGSGQCLEALKGTSSIYEDDYRTLSYTATSNVDLQLVVDANPGTHGTKGVVVDVLIYSPECVDGPMTCSNEAAGEIQYCDKSGSLRTMLCSMDPAATNTTCSAATNECIDATGGSPATAIRVVPDPSQTPQWAHNQLKNHRHTLFGGPTNSKYVCGKYVSGYENLYVVTVPNGKKLVAKGMGSATAGGMTASGDHDAVLILLDGSLRELSLPYGSQIAKLSDPVCIMTKDTKGGGFSETLEWVNNSGKDKTVYILLENAIDDSRPTALYSKALRLEVSIKQP